jgi:hypothetical protein
MELRSLEGIRVHRESARKKSIQSNVPYENNILRIRIAG